MAVFFMDIHKALSPQVIADVYVLDFSGAGELIA